MTKCSGKCQFWQFLFTNVHFDNDDEGFGAVPPCPYRSGPAAQKEIKLASKNFHLFGLSDKSNFLNKYTFMWSQLENLSIGANFIQIHESHGHLLGTVL